MNTSRRVPMLVLAASAAVLAGCKVGPNYAPPSTTNVPASWGDSTTQDSRVKSPAIAEVADLSRWWTRFNDPVLDSLVDRAAARNTDLRRAEARVQQARAQLQAISADRAPEIDAIGKAQRARFGEGVPLPGDGRTTNLFLGGFDASWELDFFGRTARQIESAGAMTEATQEARRDVLVTVLAETARAYIDLRRTQRQLDISRRQSEVLQQLRDLTAERRRAQLTDELDVSRAESLLHATRAEVPQLESRERQLMHALAILLGEQPGALVAELTEARPLPTLPPRVPIGLPSDLLRRRPDIRRAERELAASSADIGAATADLYPCVTLTGSAGFASDSASNFTHLSRGFWALGPEFRWPVLDFGRVRSAIRAREARQVESFAAYEGTVLTALRETFDALVAYGKEQAANAELHRSADAARLAVDLATDKYRHGLTDFLAVLDAQRTQYAADQATAASDATLATNLVALYKALGGGWEDQGRGTPPPGGLSIGPPDPPLAYHP